MIEVVGGPAAWRGVELQHDPSWAIRLDEAGRAELLAALARVDRADAELPGITRSDFPLPTLGPLLEALVDELVDGRGFALIRGVPIEGLSERQAELLYWGLSRYLGNPMRQKTSDDLLVHVRNEGDRDDPLVWGVKTSAHLDYHADSSDVVGLLCIRPAKSGGVSTIVSAVAVHDEIVRRRPDLAQLLYEDWWHDRRLGDGPDSFFRCPIFATNEDGALFSHYGRAYLESASRGAGIPALTERQVEALDLVDELTNDPSYVLNMNFAPGDIQFLNNYRVMHARTGYTDHAERELRRDLIRIWLVLDRDLRLPAPFETGGIIPRSAALTG
jgi:hypothetical protein